MTANLPGFRVIETETGPVVPVIDIAYMVGRDRSAITKALHKPENAPLFDGLLSTQAIKTRAGTRECVCITREGMETLIPLLRPIKRDNMPERIGAFRKALQNRKQIAPAPALSDALTEYGKRARALAEDWDVDIAVARKVLMAAAVEKYPDLTPCRALIPTNSIPLELPEKTGSNSSEPELPKADPDYDRYFGIRDVAKFCQCQENQARKILVDEGVLAYQNDHVVLTRYGERFGKVFTHYPEFPHRMVPHMLIRYSPEAVQLVRGKLFGIQTHLPQKATTGA